MRCDLLLRSGLVSCLLGMVVTSYAAEAEKAPWEVNPPIVAIQKELYKKHEKPHVAALVSAIPVGPRLELREIHSFEAHSDIADDIQARWSMDNGRTWSDFVAVQKCNIVKYQGVPVWEGEGTARYDPTSGLLVQLWLRQIERSGVYHNWTYYRTSADLGRTWSQPKPLVYEPVAEFDPNHPLNPDYLNHSEGYFGNNILVRSDGTLVAAVGHANAPGDPKNNERPWRMGSVLFFGKWNAGKNDYDWTPGARTEISPEASARGLMEPEVAELKDGRLLVVWRGSAHGWDHTVAKLPGRKFFSLSSDGGKTLAPPAEWKYSDGSSFYSPSSYHRMIRHSVTGKLYWFGNITKDPPHDDDPRYPLVVAEVDDSSGALVKSTVTTIDDRTANQSPVVQFSNFSLYEDRETHALVLHLTTYGQEPDPADWLSADDYRYTLRLKALETPAGK